MNKQDEKKFAIFIALLGTGFGKGDVTKEKIDVYFEFLRDLKIEVIEKAIKKTIRERVYPSFPTIAEIREAALGSDGEAEVAALAAWSEATRLISRGQRSRDEQINEAILMAFGSWDRFGRTEEDMEAADRAHFVRCFKAIERRKREYPMLTEKSRRLIEGQTLIDAFEKKERGEKA